MYYKHAHRLILVLMLGFVICANAGLAQAPDDAALVRSVARSFVEAYQRKDVDGLVALWSSKAAERDAFIADFRQTVSLVGSIEIKSAEISRITVEGGSDQIFTGCGPGVI